MNILTSYRPGDIISNRYLVYRKLSGTISDVYLSLDQERNIPVALKALLPRHALHLDINNLFSGAVVSQKNLERCPYVVQTFDTGDIDGQPYMVMEWVMDGEAQGNSLRRWLKRGALPLPTMLDFAIDICRGLIHIHQSGGIHGDCRPENILIGAGRVAKIADFKLAPVVAEVEQVARWARTSNPVANAREVLRTSSQPKGYRAPEQSEADSVDARADLYAFGCILYEMMFGNLPFDAKFIEQQYQQQLILKSPDPSISDEQYTPLIALLARCLAFSLVDRFANATELLCELAQVYEQMLGTPPRPTMADHRQKVLDYTTYGLVYTHMRQSNDALLWYTNAIDLDPTCAHAFLNRGQLLMRRRQIAEALIDLKQAVTLDPTLTPHVYSAYGSMYGIYHEFDEALNSYNQALDLDPKLIHVYATRGLTYINMQRYDDALTDFDIVTRFGDENAEYYSFMLYWRGHLHLDTERYDNALADWTQALQITPNDDQIYFNRANLYRKLGRYSDAIADYTQSLHLNPQQVEAFSSRGDVYNLVRRYQDALADYASALALDPQNTTILNNRGILYINLGWYSYALTDFNTVLAITSDDVTTYVNRASAYAGMNLLLEALEDCNHVIELAPDMYQTHLNRGIINQRLACYDDAESDYRRAIQAQPDEPNAYIKLGELFYQRGDSEQALDYFEQAMALGDPMAQLWVDKIQGRLSSQ